MQFPASIQTLLENTLNPSLTNQAHRQIQQIRNRQGFSTQLLIIADNPNNPINIRQSSLVTLKNLVHDQIQQHNIISQADWQTIKESILQALIRSASEKKLTPTLRQIIYLIAKNQYPDKWPNIVEIIVNHLKNSQDFGTIYASVQALKAIISVLGTSISKQVSLSNLCNKVMLPLLHLTSNLFQNFNDQTLIIIISILKIFSTAIYFHFPQIIIANLHSWMIFLKKILDNPLPQMRLLKKNSLKILLRIYQKHANSNINRTQFPLNFHQKYTKSFVESLILQLLGQKSGTFQQVIEIVNLSIAPLPFIYQQHEQSANILNQYSTKLLNLTLDIFSQATPNQSSITQFINSTREQRLQLIQLFALFINQTSFNFLIDKINQGCNRHKEIALYIIAQLSTHIRYDQFNESKMKEALVKCIFPLLQLNGGIEVSVIHARVCEVIKAYEYIQMGEQIMKPICEKVYKCLMGTNNTYLNIYAADAFASILKYDSIVKDAVPFLGGILQVYMRLMEEIQLEEVMRSMEQLLDRFADYLGPYAANLIRCLTTNFYKFNNESNQNNNLNSNQNEDSNYEDEEQNTEKSGKGFLASIRQILLASLPTEVYDNLQKDILDLIVFILLDQQQKYLEEGFNLLNLMLFKCPTIPIIYKDLYPILIYAISGPPPQLSSTQIPPQYHQIIINICTDTDKDILENVIGSLRNYLSKITNLTQHTDYCGINFLELAFTAVESVHGNTASTQSDRAIILTLYVTLLQFHCVTANQQELGRILDLAVKGMEIQMKSNMQLTYTPIYVQIIGLAFYCYPETLNFISVTLFINQFLTIINKLHADYERQRVLLGICLLMEKGMLKIERELQLQLIHCLPIFVDKQAKLRNKVEDEESIEDEAEEQNTHMIGINKNQIQEREQQEQDWDQQFNKLYMSPLEKLDELNYLSDVLKGPANHYVNYLTIQQQQLLSNAIVNVSPRNINM